MGLASSPPNGFTVSKFEIEGSIYALANIKYSGLNYKLVVKLLRNAI